MMKHCAVCTGFLFGAYVKYLAINRSKALKTVHILFFIPNRKEATAVAFVYIFHYFLCHKMRYHKREIFYKLYN